jgi:autotransporter-associated beta strand protein
MKAPKFVFALIFAVFLVASVPGIVGAQKFTSLVASAAQYIAAQTVRTFTSLSDYTSSQKSKPTSAPTPAPLANPDGTLTTNANGNRSDTTKWSGDTVANGGGSTDFNTINLSGDPVVTINTTSRTVGGTDIVASAPLVDPDGTWTANANGMWSDTTKWAGGIVADGGGFADFSTVNLTADRDVTIDISSRIVRRIDIGDTNNTHSYDIKRAGSLTLIFDNTANSANAQLNQTSGSAGDTISAPIVLNSSLDITNAAAATLTLSGGITSGTTGTKTITTSTGLVRISGVIGNGSGTVAVVQNGPGTLTLAGNNTFTGGLTINAGTLSATSQANALGGSGTGSVTLGNTSGSASATLLGDGRTFANPITVASGSSGTLTIGNSGSTSAVFSGAVTLNNNLTLTASGAGSVKLSGGVTGTGNIVLNNTGTANSTFLDTTLVDNIGTITNSGSGTGTATIHSKLGGNVTQLIQNSSTSILSLTMTANTAFVGSVAVNAGTLEIGSATALNSSNVVSVAAGATLDFNGQSQTIAGLDGGTGTVTNHGGSHTVTLAGSGTYSFGGVITADDANHNDMTIVKSGSGTQTLTGASLYNGGTTVSGGTLFVNNTTGSGTGTNAVMVSNSGTVLGGTGTISGAVTVNANSKLQGGTGTTGATQKLTLSGALTLADNSIIQLALGPSGTHSTLARTGTGTWTFDSNQAFTFINLGATPGTYENIITGVLNPPSEGSWTITNAGFIGTFSWDGVGAGTGNIDLVLTAVPEPSTWLAGALALGAVLYSQRRRFKAGKQITYLSIFFRTRRILPVLVASGILAGFMILPMRLTADNEHKKPPGRIISPEKPPGSPPGSPTPTVTPVPTPTPTPKPHPTPRPH